MSKVTALILSISPLENEEKVLSQLRGFKYRNLEFNIVSIHDKALPLGWYGGTKFFPGHLFIGSYNYFGLDGFVRHLLNRMEWEDPEIVQLFVKEEEHEHYRLINPFGEFTAGM